MTALAVAGVLLGGVVASGPATADTPTPAAPRIQSAKASVEPVVVGTSKTKTLHAHLAVTEHSTRRADVVIDTPERLFKVPLIETDNYDSLSFWEAEVPIKPSSLKDDEAGRWMTTFRVLDRDPESRITLQAKILRATRARLDARPEPVQAGAVITVTGKLERASWSHRRYQGYAGQPATLEFRTSNGSYRPIKTVTTGSGGAVGTTVRATGDGYYRLTYPGNGTSGPTRTAGDRVDVN